MTTRTARRVLLLAAAIVLSSCIDKPLLTDIVRDEEAALAIAKGVCKFPDDKERHLSVWLHDGVWDVRQYYPGNSGACGWNGAKVRASDGHTDGCEGCTVTD
jgi:hypothetical protein